MKFVLYLSLFTLSKVNIKMTPQTIITLQHISNMVTHHALGDSSYGSNKNPKYTTDWVM